MQRRNFGNVRKLPSGRWQASYFHDGKRNTAPHTFRAKADANAYLSTAETDIRRGGWIDPDRALIHFSVVARQWLAAGTTKRDTSVDRDQSIITNHLEPLFGDRAIGSIRPPQVQAAVDEWATTHAPSTVARHYAILRAICAYAESSEMILRSPCRGIKLPRVRLVDRPDLSPEDLERLGEKLGDQAPFMWLGAICGLRWAEAAGLTVGSLDMLAGTITIDHQLNRSGELVTPKSEAGTRTLAVPSWLVNELAAVLALRGLTAADGDALVFVNGERGPLAYTNWRRRTWLPACEKAKLPDLRFHDLRSVAASALIGSGVDVKTAQSRMGHSSSRMTLDLYARSRPAADRKAADAVGDLLRPSRTKRARPNNRSKRAAQ
jgi:integrase